MAYLLSEHRLAYFPVPKCACTSLKQLFFAVENGFPFRRFRVQGKKWGVHDLVASDGFSATDHAAIAEWCRIAVVRDPVSRVASCYADKVVAKQALARLDPEAELGGLPVAPSFADFVRHLPEYQRRSVVIAKHTRPLSFFLGRDPAYFDRLVPLRDLAALAAFVTAHTNTDAVLPHRMQSPRQALPADPSHRELRRIEDLFAEDLEIFGRFL